MSEQIYSCPQCRRSYQSSGACPDCNVPVIPVKGHTRAVQTRKFKYNRSDLPDNIPIPDTDRATLLIYRKKEFYKTIDIEERENIVVGRSPDADIWLALETVSKQHCRIFQEGGQFYIEDLKSRNGTFVNTEVLSPRKARPIEDGDVIRVSAFYLCCHIIEKEGASPVAGRAIKGNFYSDPTVIGSPSPSPSATPRQDDNADTIKMRTVGDEETSTPEKERETREREALPNLDNLDNLDIPEGEEAMNTMMAIQSDRKIKEKFDEAEKVVSHYLKPIPERIGRAHLSYLYKPLVKIGGDFYSVFDLDEDRVAVALGDVSGHGMPAALIMIACITMLELHGRESSSPGYVMSRVNLDIISRLERGKFVTVIYGILNTRTGEFCYSSAGHPPPVIYNPQKGKAPESLKGRGPGFGIIEREVNYEEQTIYLESGDRLIFFTDGVLEAGKITKESERSDFIVKLKDLLAAYDETNFDDIIDQVEAQIEEWHNRDEIFGLQGLKEVIEGHPQSSPQEIVEIIYEALERYTYPKSVDDDITLIAIDWKKK